MPTLTIEKGSQMRMAIREAENPLLTVAEKRWIILTPFAYMGIYPRVHAYVQTFLG